MADVTMVIALRAHERNPWVLERLRALAGHYTPSPQVLVVDFGSSEVYRTDIETECRRAGFAHLYVDDEGVFSLAKARNAGAAACRTELLFFSDIDCFGEQDLFGRMVDVANAQGIGACFDHLLLLPVYHLAAQSSAEFFEAGLPAERSRVLGRAFFRGALEGRGAHVEYVDPHSNFFLIRRDFFDYLGGFNEAFRGHGSEDFEFLLRLSRYSTQYPLPESAVEDLFSPRQTEFYGPRPYRGFRRLLELMAQPAELAGLRIAHLHHPRGRDCSGWYENNDWSRSCFAQQVAPFLEHRSTLLTYDWMPRAKKALVLLKHEVHADMLFPLRLFGYQLIPARADDVESLERAAKLLEQRAVDVVVIFNPYMKSHLELRMFFEVARKSGIATLVIERGPLPESWYYAPDMSYADPDFSTVRFAELEFTPDECCLADEYITRLRAGGATLEGNGSYSETRGRRQIYRLAYRQVCLIPLQLEDDAAVTRFAEGRQPYLEFVEQVRTVAARFPEVLFLVKAHPLSGAKFELEADNVVCCGPEDNIHALIDLSDRVVCYNSGVGLLALMHGKRLVTVGNAFYNVKGMGRQAQTLTQAVELAVDPDAEGFHTFPVRQLVAWMILKKYSFFRGRSVVRDLGTRKVHAYKDVLWYQLNLPGKPTIAATRAAFSLRPGAKSYVAARLGIGADLSALAEGAPAVKKVDAAKSSTAKQGAKNGAAAHPIRPSDKQLPRAAGSKLRKLVRDPRRFMSDSKYSTLRWLARHVDA
ncbi:MAG: galactosyltransferase-related protein [Myxococcales bacterium]